MSNEILTVVILTLFGAAVLFAVMNRKSKQSKKSKGGKRGGGGSGEKPNDHHTHQELQ